MIVQKGVIVKHKKRKDGGIGLPGGLSGWVGVIHKYIRIILYMYGLYVGSQFNPVIQLFSYSICLFFSRDRVC